MEAFLSSTLAVAISEIGDKTQLLTLFLVSRFANKTAIILGILVSTLLNHVLSAWLGSWFASLIAVDWLPWIVGLSFIAIGLWILIPDKDEESGQGILKYGAFIATCVLFFLAEIGDKTQIATVVLAARYDALVSVIAGSTLGILIANVPVALLGGWLIAKIPLDWTRWLACALFIILGLLTLLGAGGFLEA